VNALLCPVGISSEAEILLQSPSSMQCSDSRARENGSFTEELPMNGSLTSVSTNHILRIMSSAQATDTLT